MRIAGWALSLAGVLGLAISALVFWAMAGHFDYGFLGFAGLAKALAFVGGSVIALIGGVALIATARRNHAP